MSAVMAFKSQLPMRKNIVAGCTRLPFGSPNSVGTPARNATSPSPVQSITTLPRMKSRPRLEDTITPVSVLPSRTGCNILPETIAVLAEHPNIVAVKEASGNISQIAEIAALTRGKIDIYSGNDDQIVPILALGGKGVISVLSNPMPRATSEICHKFFAGDVAGSLKLQLDLLPLVNALFCEVNPIPVKAAMAAMGFGENSLRLPLTTMEKAHEEKLLSLMREQGLI